LRNLRRFDEAITALQDAAAIYRETGDRKSEGTALNNLGLALRKSGGSIRRSLPVKMPLPSTGKPATATARAAR